MNIRPQYRNVVATFLLFSSLGWLVEPARATAVDIAPQPLFLLGSVDPNIMLMVDNSGSMQNIVPDEPYVSTNIYLANCPTTNSNRVAAGTAVVLRVVSGAPRISISGTSFAWGTGPAVAGVSRRCFEPNTDYTAAKLHADSPVGTGTSGYLPAQYKGNYLNWYFNVLQDPAGCSNTWTGSGKKPCTKSRMEIAKSASKSLIDSLGADNRVGFSTYNSGAGGSLREVVDDLTTAKRTSIKTKIDALAASGNTPLAETLSDIGRYFATGYTANLTLHPGQGNQATATVATVFNGHSFQNSSGVASPPSPVQYFCQKNFAVMLTDGRPQGDRAISTSLRDYTGDCAAGLCSATANTTSLPSGPLPNNSFGNGTKAGHAYESDGSDYLDDVANGLYEMDLRPDLLDPAGKVDDKNNLTTFMIGFADDQAINDPLMISTASHGGGQFLPAGNSQALIQAFDTIAAIIKKDKPSAAALAANSTSVEIGAVVFQAVFDSTDWSGDLVAFPVDKFGVVAKNAPYWQAGLKLTDPATRKIYTIDVGTLTNSGTDDSGFDFVWGPLNTDQKASLNTDATGATDIKGADRLAWIRGVHDREARKPGGEFRNRERTIVDLITGVSSKQEWILGDIVNSDPVFMHANDFGYAAQTWTGASNYATYLSSKSTSKPLVFVGGNDGMLHAFRVDTADTSSGKELFAYVPNAVYPNLSKLSTVGYTHAYFVDGSPTVGDAYFGGAWHTMLVSGLAAGGKSVFALDVTEFATKSPELATPSASTMVKWEISDADMGLTYSKPQIARLNNGVWAAIFGNGYNSTSEQAYLYVVNIETGVVIKKIASGLAGSNGLSTPILYDKDGDKVVDYVYAGDLQGNLWKFDLSDTTTSTWGVAYNGSPAFTARNLAGQVQPITAQPTLGSPPTVTPTPTDPGVMVYFGTGQYLQNVDISDSKKQSFYGIWDNGTAISSTDRSDLQPQSIVSTDVAFSATLRTTSANPVDWATQRGWYMDFNVPAEPGERVVTQALLRYDRVIFLTLIPSSAVCQPGGSSWLMELDALTGARTTESSFDFNNDGVFDSGDYVAGSPVSGYKSTVGITKPPAWFTGTDGKDFKVMTGTTGGIESLGNKGGPPPVPPGPGGGVFRRTYWLQIQ